MSLVFEYEKALPTGRQAFISHEEDSTLYNYFVDGELSFDKNTVSAEGIYTNVAFTGESSRHLTTKAVERIGIKNFPGIGGMGFYKDAYSEDSRVLAPILTDRHTFDAPTLQAATINNGKLHLVVAPPSGMTYTCYRVIARQGNFAFEYIIYKTNYVVDLPTVKGAYVVTCLGYNETTGAISDVSNAINLQISTGSDTWAPPATDTSALEARVEAIEIEIVNYPDTEVHDDIAEILAEEV